MRPPGKPVIFTYFDFVQGGPEIGGIFIKALMPGGAAEKDGRILVGKTVFSFCF